MLQDSKKNENFFDINLENKNNFNKNYSFFRLFCIKDDFFIKNDFDLLNFTQFSLVGINFFNSPFVEKYFYDPLIYLIIKSLFQDLVLLKINFESNLILKLNLAFKKNEYDLFEIFQSLIEIIIKNSLCINNINVYIMAEYPKFKNEENNFKILIKNNIKKIFENQFGEKTNFFLKKISVHAGTGEKIGLVGNSQAIDLHVLTNLVKICDANQFIGYGFDRHQMINQYNPYYKNDKNFNCLGGSKFIFKNSLQIKSHSDGDLIFHSICDGIFGALGEGDIGDFFPDNDLNNKNKDSIEFINFALNLALKKNFQLKKINIKLFVNCFIYDDLVIQNALNQIHESISYKIKLKKDCIKFSIIPVPLKENKKGCIARSEGIESQAFVFFEQIKS